MNNTLTGRVNYNLNSDVGLCIVGISTGVFQPSLTSLIAQISNVVNSSVGRSPYFDFIPSKVMATAI